ncbi:MAG: glutaminase, partial [Microbacterium sp.]
AQARRGGFAEGEVLHIGWQVLDADAVDAGSASGPLALLDGEPGVRWSPSGGLIPLAGYLDEKIGMLRG